MSTYDDPAVLAYARRLFEDPLFFLDELWLATGLNRRAPLGPIERDIYLFACGYDSDGITPLPAHRVGLAWRGIGKSTSAVAPAACWKFYRDHERRILIPSKSDTQARNVVSLTKSWIKNVPFLQHLRPRKGQRDGEYRYDLGPSSKIIQPSMTAIGIDGQLEGNRAHSIYPDDTETDKNTISVDARAGLRDRVGEFNDILYPESADDPDVIPATDPTEICYVGTYHHEESLYIHLHELGYFVRTWPLVVPQPDWKIIGLAPIVQAMIDRGVPPMTPVNPVRFGRDEVLKRQKHGPRRFLMQHALVSDLGDKARYQLRLSDLIVFPCGRDKAPVSLTWGQTDNRGSTAIDDIPLLGFNGDRLHRPIRADEAWFPYEGTTVWIDPSGHGEDACAASAVGYLAGFYFLKGTLSLPSASSHADMQALAGFCRLHGATSIYAESNADTLGLWRPFFESILRTFYLEPGDSPEFPNGWRCPLADNSKITHSTGQKEVRILDALGPVIASHRLIAHPDAIRPVPGKPAEVSLQYQLTRLTRERGCLPEDGLIDTLEGCLRVWQHALAEGQAEAQARIKATDPGTEDPFQDFLAKIEHRAPRRAPGPNWILRDRSPSA